MSFCFAIPGEVQKKLLSMNGFPRSSALQLRLLHTPVLFS